MEEEEEIESQGFRTCGKGHRSSLLLPTPSGGTICIVCFSNLVSDPCSPSHHVSYAISQLSQAIDGFTGVEFRRNLIRCHVHLLVTPLVQAMCLFEDEAVGRQVVDLVSNLCCGRGGQEGVEGLVRDFVFRIGDRVASGVLGWSGRQINILHCLGILLDQCHQSGESRTGIRDRTALVSSLLLGVQLPSEEIRGEIFFVLYKLCLLKEMPWDDDNYIGVDNFWTKLMQMSLEALLKIQRDDVRLNCIAFLSVLLLRRRPSYNRCGGTLEEKDHLLQTEPVSSLQMANLLADVVKGPLLSSDTHVQIATLDLVFHFLSSEDNIQLSQVFVKEGIAEYVFEILRHSGNGKKLYGQVKSEIFNRFNLIELSNITRCAGKNDLIIIPSIRLLDLLAIAEEFLRQRLTVGLPVLLSTVQYVAEIPLHPVQIHALRLVKGCMSNSPGALSRSQLEELALVLTEILRRHTSGELGILPETFVLVCSIFVEIIKSPSSGQLPRVNAMLQEASKSVIFSSMSLSRNSNGVILHALYFLKEAYCYVHGEVWEIQCNELDSTILDICKDHLLPWLRNIYCEDIVEDEDDVLGVLELFHFILIQGPHIQSRKFAEILASSSWFSLSFGLLGLFLSERMKCRLYMMLSSIIDGVLGEDLGEPIRNAYQCLPSDPLDLIFLLGQKTSLDVNFLSAQSAVISILFCSSLYDERIADDSHVFASLEQYLLVNSSNFSREILGSFVFTQLLHLYSFLRGTQANRGITLYSLEAENILFQLITENDWDLLHMCIHPTALKWLFKQDRLIKPLSDQLLRFCRHYNKSDNQPNGQANTINMLPIETIAELVLCGDNLVASLLIILIRRMQEESKEDVVSVVNVIQAILDISPEASNELCLHGFDSAIYDLYCSNFVENISSHCSVLIFSVLQSVHSEILSLSGSSWLQLTLKLLEYHIPKSADGMISKEACQVIGILSLILNHSMQHALVDASKVILLNSSVISLVHAMVQAHCAKGPASTDHFEETTTEEVLTFVLLLYFFSLKSLHALLQEGIDWEDFLYPSDGNQRPAVICIHCQDLCRLMHFGCSSVKLVASQCLVELLTRISYQRDKVQDKLRCSVHNLQSLIAITEGLIFYENSIVATNCGLCFSMILGWEKLGTDKKRAFNVSKWCRLIVEELALSLAMSSSTSKSFTIYKNPAIYVAIAYLKLDQKARWVKSIFNPSSISGIINKLSACNLRAEVVELFRELYVQEYLNKEHVKSLKNVFQACQKHLYDDRVKNCCLEENIEETSISSGDAGSTCKVLLHLMLSSSMFCSGTQTKEKKLLVEIEFFLQLLRE